MNFSVVISLYVRHVGDIGDPQAVGPVHLEIPVGEIGGGTGVVIANRGVRPLAPVNALNASLAHQPRYTLA